jgi:hypothetical protein
MAPTTTASIFEQYTTIEELQNKFMARGEARGVAIGEARGEARGVAIGAKIMSRLIKGDSPEKIAADLNVSEQQVLDIAKEIA